MTRDEAIQVCYGLESNWFMSDEIREAMTLAIEALKQQEQKYGKWIWTGDEYTCSECEYHAYGKAWEILNGVLQSCPNCGAKMEVEK